MKTEYEIKDQRRRVNNQIEEIKSVVRKIEETSLSLSEKTREVKQRQIVILEMNKKLSREISNLKKKIEKLLFLRKHY